MLLGLAVLARRWHIGPRSNQTVLSQIMGMAVGRHWAYYILSLTITVVLALAANTSFGGLPILASLLARDHYLPHLFALRGDRQVFGNGIWVLSGLSAGLLIAVGGNTNLLIPLFAIGVFTGFTLSQAGLVVHWWRKRPPRWHYRAPGEWLRCGSDCLGNLGVSGLEVCPGGMGCRPGRPRVRPPFHADPCVLPTRWLGTRRGEHPDKACRQTHVGDCSRDQRVASDRIRPGRSVVDGPGGRRCLGRDGPRR